MWLRGLVLGLICLFSFGSAHGLSSQFDVLLDLDGDPSSGCEVTTPSGSFAGVEAILTTFVETAGLDAATVSGVQRRDCADPDPNVFGAPQTVSAGGWPVGIGNGQGGFNVIETFMTGAIGSPFMDTRLALIATDELGNTSLVTANAAGNPIVLGGIEPLPVSMLSGLVLLGLAVMLFLVGLVMISRRGRLTLTALVCLAGASAAGAACVLDGEIFNWDMADLLTETGVTDSENGVDIRALFGKRTDGDTQLCFRIDAALVFATVPVVADDGYAAAEATLLDIAAGDGLLANDTLGIPEATLVSFGGGDLGGDVGDHAAGATISVGTDGSLTVDADGGLQFQAATGFDGDFSFDYRVENTAGNGQATVTIEVQTIPAAMDDSFDTLIDEALNVTTPGVLANDTGSPDPTVVSFGSGDLGGAVDEHAAGSAATIAPDGSVVVNADGGLTYTPPSGFSGEFSFDYRIENAAGDAQATITIAVDDPPAITSADSHSCAVGEPCEFSFSAEGFPDPTITLDGSVPDGVSFNAATESLEGTPDSGTGNEYNLAVTADNGISPEAIQAFMLTINEAPTITSAENLTCEVGTACIFTVTADGFPDPTFDLPDLPAGLSLDATTGELTGTPDADTGAVHKLTLTASNGIAPDDDQAFTLTVNEAPTITSADNLTCEIGSACNFTFTADGFPESTFELSGLPSGLSLNATTGELSGTPDAGTGAEYNLTLTAMNGIAPDDTQGFILTINEAPTITSADNLTCILNESCSFAFTAEGFPNPTYGLSSVPSGLNLDPDSGQLSGTPDTDGVFNLTLTATNAAGSDNQAITLTIGSPPAITSADNITCEVGSVCAFTFTADGTPVPSIDVTGTLPAGISFNAATDSLEGTPDAATGALYDLSVSASNGIAPDASQDFSLTVNEAPVANNDPEGGIPGGSSPGSMAYHGAFNTTLSVSAADGVLDNDNVGFPQAGIVSFDDTSTGGGSVILNADGSFSYTPAGGFTGIDTFQYCIENAAAQDCAIVDVAVGVRPSAADSTYPQTLVGNVGIDTTVDSGFSVSAGGDDVTFAVVDTTNGDATIDANGTFVFNPTAGVTGVNGLLDFSVSNGFGSTTATVTIPIGANRIWFADNSAAAGDGRLGTPFNSLDAVAAAANATDDRIFLHTGSVDYIDGIALLDDQRLLGQGAGQALAAIAGVTPPSDSMLPATGGTAPLIVNAGGSGVALAQNNRLEGFGVGNTSGSGVAGNGFGTLTVLGVSISGTGQALDLTNGSLAGAGFSSVTSGSGSRNVSLVNVGGTLDLGGGALSGATNQGFFVDGGSGTISYAGSVSNASNRVAEVRNKTGGSVTLSGNLTSNSGGSGIELANNGGGTAITFSGASKVLSTGTGAAVTLSGNSGATIAFNNGGLDIDTTSGTGFDATGGGTVIVTGTGNTVDGTTGTSISIVNTTIGAAGVGFQRVSSNGGTTPGVVLSSTGISGGLTVTGNGGSCTSAATCTGGSIRGKTGNVDGISMTNTVNSRFNFVHIANNTRNGIFGSAVNGFELVDSLVDGNADQASPDEAGILMTNLSGTLAGGSNPVRILRSTIRNSYEHNIKIENNAGTLADLLIEDSFVRDTPAGTGANGLLLQAIGTASMGATVINSSFIANKSNGIQADAGDALGSFVRVDVDNSTFTGAGNSNASDPAAQNVGVNVSVSNAGSAEFMITDSSFIGHRAIGINFFANANSSAATIVEGTITGNTIGTQGVANSGSAIGTGIDISNEGENRIDLLIDSNIVQGVGDGTGNGFEGIFINDIVSTGTINATVTNNTVRDIFDDRGLVVQERVGGAHCYDISGNAFIDIGGISDMRVRQTSGTLNVVQADPAGAAPNLSTVNGNAAITVTGAPSFSVGSACPTP